MKSNPDTTNAFYSEWLKPNRLVAVRCTFDVSNMLWFVDAYNTKGVRTIPANGFSTREEAEAAAENFFLVRPWE